MAIIDAYSGVDVLGLVMLIVIFALAAVDFDIPSRISIERLTMIGDDDSHIPRHTPQLPSAS